jgi:N,N'-diacetylbacillosaminyl-diphospho-undecaprenol alpha-1,3-N-acetylgalactosaminyltransferase
VSVEFYSLRLRSLKAVQPNLLVFEVSRFFSVNQVQYMYKVIHNIHFPISARSFVEPIVSKLNDHQFDAELWLEKWEGYLDTINSIEVPKRLINSNLTFNPIEFISKVQAYRLALRETQPDIVHAHQTRSSLIPLLSAYLEHVPIRIYHNHGLPYLGYKGIMRWLLRSLERINISLATEVLLVSHSNLQAAREDRLLNENQGKVISSGSICGIDLQQYAPHQFDNNAQIVAREKLQIDRNSFVLGYVGRPCKRKGFHRLLTAWQESHLGDRGNILLMSGCSNEDIHAIVGDSVAGVCGLGYINNMLEFYAACDAVVLPSDHEGFPYAMLEAAAAEKALIGTDIPGISCTIEHNQTGLLVPLDDSNALQEAIVKVASDSNLRIELGKKARVRVKLKFDRELVLSELLSFYDALLKKDSIVSSKVQTDFLRSSSNKDLVSK